ncbi:deoxyribonuclease IV [Candidatus Kuenenbacteria bacterium]|nr:deoxyribonuclease IV [Candidatus Kuenenbacteria bacterium]
MFIGAHISASGGLENAPANAHNQGCECYQFFSRSPQGGPVKKLSPADIKKFRLANQRFGFRNFYVHAPYFINLASSNNRIYYGSISVLREELERGSLLGVKYLMTHLGSAKDLGAKQALKKVIAGLEKILDGYHGSTELLIEISAGSGAIIGDTFEELAAIIGNWKLEIGNCPAICFDTAHAFESGYDLHDEKSVQKTFSHFDKIIGLKKLKLLHLNDSKTTLGSHSDRHADLGSGAIGLTGFSALIKYLQKKKLDIDLVLETPTDSRRKKDIQTLKNIRDNK